MTSKSRRRKQTRLLSIIAWGVLVVPFVSGCTNDVVNVIPSGDYILCYEKEFNGNWEIFTNDISGTSPVDISNNPGDDEYPQWSPNGRYIVYSRRMSSGVVQIVVYNVKNQSSILITSDSVDAGLTPQWTPDGKIIYFARSSYDLNDSGATYVVDPDGGQKRKILDCAATIYFYKDGQTFLYILNYTEVHESSIDNGEDKFLFDINKTLGQQGAIIRDFNPIANELLISPNSADGRRQIATYGVAGRNLNILLTGEEGCTFFQMRYSNDFSKIVVVEHDSSDEYLSIIKEGTKKRIMRIAKSSPPANFSYEPMAFSPDDKYIAFSEQIWRTGQWISFSTPLFVIGSDGGTPYKFEDEAHGPSWNPLP